MPRGGSKPGERRGGRSKGTPNTSTAAVKALAQRHGAAAINQLARIMTKGASEQARVAACKEILDRGYGKSMQPLEGELMLGLNDSAIGLLAKLLERHDGKTRGLPSR